MRITILLLSLFTRMLNLLHVAVLFLNSIVSRQMVHVLWHLDFSCIYLELNTLMLDFLCMFWN